MQERFETLRMHSSKEESAFYQAIGEIRSLQKDDPREARIRTLGIVARTHLTTQATQVRKHLQQRVGAFEDIGPIPSLFTLMGLSHRERPYNLLLGWICDPCAEHRAGRAVLRVLANQLGPNALVEDLTESSNHIEIRRERRWPSWLEDSRMPDLLILSPRAVLLIENKVNTGESSEGQFTDYLDTLKRLCTRTGQEREWAAWLAAPEKSKIQAKACELAEWRAITHKELANLLADAAMEPDVPAWGRVSCLLVAEQFRHASQPTKWLDEAHILLSETNSRPPSVDEIARMASLVSRLKAPTSPWKQEPSNDT